MPVDMESIMSVLTPVLALYGAALSNVHLHKDYSIRTRQGPCDIRMDLWDDRQRHGGITRDAESERGQHMSERHRGR